MRIDMEKYKALEAENERLTKQLSARDEAIKLLLSFAPKDCPEGLDPTFYFTLTYAGDKEIQDRIDGIRAALPQESNDVLNN